MGRLLWLGPMLVLPLLMTVVLFSAGYVKAIWFGLLAVLTVYALFGLDLWQPIAWAVQWRRRPQRRGCTTPMADRPGTAVNESGEEEGAFRSLLARVRGAVAAPRGVAAVVVDPPAIEYSDPDGLWRRWAEALRRALAGGATVQVVTWLEPDWDPARWESERRAVLRLPGGNLQEMAAQRWDLHRHLSLAAGRRAVQMVRVLGAADSVGEFARQCGTALAGAGTWTTLDGEAARDAAQRWVDWPAWSAAQGSGPDEMAVWLGHPVPDEGPASATAVPVQEGMAAADSTGANATDQDRAGSDDETVADGAMPAPGAVGDAGTQAVTARMDEGGRDSGWP